MYCRITRTEKVARFIIGLFTVVFGLSFIQYSLILAGLVTLIGFGIIALAITGRCFQQSENPAPTLEETEDIRNKAV